LIEKLKVSGWRVELVYLALPSVEYSHERVQERVLAGGHSIPSVDVERRFPKSLQNLLGDFSDAVDRTQCFLNDTAEPEIIFTETVAGRIIINQKHYERLLRNSQK
jgi:predicted ABC-type ATPase